MMYKEMYYTLFNAITDAVDQLEQCNYGQAASILKQAQAAAEEIYVSAPDQEPPLDNPLEG